MRSIKLPSWIERLAGLDPKPVPGSVFSLDEGRLSYARFQRKDGALEFSDYRSVELEEETFQAGPLGGSVRKEAALGQALADLLEGTEEPVSEACLLLPDAWLRLAFTEIGELPADPEKLDEALRWKLKRLVPFRVDELRLEGIEVRALPGQDEPKRALIGFALDSMLERLEDLFQQAGVEVGYIGNVSTSVLPGLAGGVVPDEALLGLALIRSDGYTLLFARGGEPVLHRYKASDGALPYEVREQRVQRDLKLTRSFLDERMPGAPLERVLVLTAPEVEDPWPRWLEDGLQSQTERLKEEHMAPLSVQLSHHQAREADSWLEIAPLLGASCLETA